MFGKFLSTFIAISTKIVGFLAIFRTLRLGGLCARLPHHPNTAKFLRNFALKRDAVTCLQLVSDSETLSSYMLKVGCKDICAKIPCWFKVYVAGGLISSSHPIQFYQSIHILPFQPIGMTSTHH